MEISSWTDEKLEEFSENLSQHKVLLQPVRYKKIRGRAIELLQLGAKYGYTELRDFLKLMYVVRQGCIIKMRQLVEQYGVADALGHAPFWLQRLNRPFELVTTAVRLAHIPPQALAEREKAVWFTWELYACVRQSARADGDKPSWPAVIAEFAAERKLKQGTVHAIWSRLYESALTRLKSSTQAGDLGEPSGDRLSTLEWRVIDLALLYDDTSALSPNPLDNTAETEALLLLYGLMAPKRKHAGPAERRPPTTESAPATDRPPETRLQAEYDGTADKSISAPDAGAEWESAHVWATVTAEYCKSGREVSQVTLQRRWYELLGLARRALLRVRTNHQYRPHALLLALAKRFPYVVTSPLPPWKVLVQGDRIHIDPVPVTDEVGKAGALDDAKLPSSMPDLTANLLEWNDDDDLEIIETNYECIVINSDDEDSDINKVQNTQKEPPLKIKTEPVDNTDTTSVKQNNTNDTSTQKPVIKSVKPLNVTKSETLHQTAKALLNSALQKYITRRKKEPNTKHPKSSTDNKKEMEERNSGSFKSRIVFEDEEDFEELFNFNENLTMCNNTHSSSSETTNVKSKPNNKQDKETFAKDTTVSNDSNRNKKIATEEDEFSNKSEQTSTEIGKSNISEFAAHSSDKCAQKSISHFKRLLVDNYYKKVPRDSFKQALDKFTTKQAVPKQSVTSAGVSEEGGQEADVHIDMKLLQLCRVVVTPVDQLAEWRNARGGTLDCRGLSVERLAAPVGVRTRQFNACRRYHQPQVFAALQPALPTTSTSLERARTRGCVAQRIRDDIRCMPRELQMIRKRLTRRLRLPRTLPGNFWRSARNVSLVRQCRGTPHVRLERLAARTVKRVELSDIEEVRRINRTLLTAQVAPITVEKPSIESNASAADSGLATRSGAVANEVEGDSLEPVSPNELPNEKDLMAMIKTLVVPSIETMRAALQPASGASALRERNTRDVLEDDICRLLSGNVSALTDTHVASPKTLSRKPQQQTRKKRVRVRTLCENETPLSDPAQEWKRQKNLVLKYFSFNRPGDQSKPKPINRQPTDNRQPANRSESKYTDAKDTPNIKRHQTKTDINHVAKEECPSSDTKKQKINKPAPIIRVKYRHIIKQTQKKPITPKTLCEEEKPLPDAFQEWKRQKNLVLKYFNFNQPDNEAQPTQTNLQNLANESECKMPNSVVVDSPNNENLRKSVHKIKINKGAKRLRIGNIVDSSNKMLKLDKDIGKTVVKVRAGDHSDSDDDDNRMIIDEGIEDRCEKDAPVPSPTTDRLADAAPANTTTAVPIDNIPGLRSIQEMPANMVYIVKKKSTVGPLSLSNVKMPGNAPTKPNTPPKIVLNTDAPMYVFAQKGTQPLKELSEFKVHAGPTLKSILVNKLNSTLKTYSKTFSDHSTPKSMPKKFAKLSQPGPLSSKRKVISTIRKSVDTSQLKIAAQIDLTDETVENEAQPGSSPAQIVSNSSLTKIKQERVDLEKPLDSATNDGSPKESVTQCWPSDDKKMLCLEVGPIVPGTNRRPSTKTGVQTICLDSDASNESVQSVDKNTFSIKKEPADGNNEDRESMHADVKTMHTIVKDKAPETDAVQKIPPPTTQGPHADSLPKAPSELTTNKILSTADSNSAPSNKSLPKASKQPKVKNPKSPTVKNTPKAKPQAMAPIPTKITATTTSKDLLKLSTKELARLLEDDESPVDPEPQTSAVPLKSIQKEKLSEEERTKEAKLSTAVNINKEPGAWKGNDEEHFLVDIPIVCEPRDAEPELVNDDDTVFSLRSLGRTSVDAAEHAARAPLEEPLLKLDPNAPLWLLSGKYVLLTDDDVKCERPSLLASTPPYPIVNLPESKRPRQELDLGIKKGRDVIVCCCGGAKGDARCAVCQSVDGEFEIIKPAFKKVCNMCGVDPTCERARIYTIKARSYRKIADRPLKYATIERLRRCPECRDGVQFVARPDSVQLNGKRFEKLCDEPLQYAPVLSVVPGAAEGARLARRGADLYLLHVRTGRRARLVYRAEPGHAPLNAAAAALMNRIDREELDARYRRGLAERDGGH